MAFSGKNLKYIRIRKDWTLDDLSKLSGVNKGYLSNLENGIQTNPGLEIVEKLAKAFDMPVQAMIVLLKPNPAENVGIGGELLSDKEARE